MKRTLILCGIGLLFPFASHAAGGNGAGNGGNVVVCQNRVADEDLELLDFYEARVFRGIDQDPSLSTGSSLDIVRSVLDRLARISPQRAERLIAQASTFAEDSLYLPLGTHLEEIPDSEHLGFPDNCRIKQLVTQRTPQFPEDKRYFINTDLWKKLDERNKAGAILHELLYREVLDRFDVTNSVGVRYINSILWSSKFSKMRDHEFNDLLTKSRFCQIEAQGAFFLSCGTIFDEYGYISPVHYYSSGLISKAYAVTDSWLLIQNTKVYIAGWVYFDESGKVKKITLQRDTKLSRLDGTVEIFPKGSWITLNSLGMVTGREFRGFNE